MLLCDCRPLLETAARCQPGLNGRIGGAAHTDLCCRSPGNPARIQALHAHWRQAHPEAGPLHWSARSWSQLIWQPIYLCVLGPHLNALVPRLAQLSQTVCNGVVSGYSFTSPSAWAVAPTHPIGRASRQLRLYLAHQWRECASVFRLPPKLAQHWATDYVLAALLLVQRHLGLSNPDLRALERHWLKAMGMHGSSSLMEVALSHEHTALALNRKMCCQHLRCAQAQACSNCPHLEPQQRLTLLRQELTPPHARTHQYSSAPRRPPHPASGCVATGG